MKNCRISVQKNIRVISRRTKLNIGVIWNLRHHRIPQQRLWISLVPKLLQICCLNLLLLLLVHSRIFLWLFLTLYIFLCFDFPLILLQFPPQRGVLLVKPPCHLSRFLFVEDSTSLFVGSYYTFCRGEFNPKLLSNCLNGLFVNKDSLQENSPLFVGNDGVFHFFK